MGTDMTNDAYKDELNAAAARGAAKRERLNMHAPGEPYTEADLAAMKRATNEREAKAAIAKAAQPLQAILAERGSRYGKFTDHAETTQEIKAALYRRLKGKSLMPDQIEALEMIAHKMGRIVSGDPDHEEPWRDIAGYATLVADRLKNGEER